MTRNQLQYWANMEQARANRARETEDRRYHIDSVTESRDYHTGKNAAAMKQATAKADEVVLKGIETGLKAVSTLTNTAATISKVVNML